jgi:hypothetical protein
VSSSAAALRHAAAVARRRAERAARSKAARAAAAAGAASAGGRSSASLPRAVAGAAHNRPGGAVETGDGDAGDREGSGLLGVPGAVRCGFCDAELAADGAVTSARPGPGGAC